MSTLQAPRSDTSGTKLQVSPADSSPSAHDTSCWSTWQGYLQCDAGGDLPRPPRTQEGACARCVNFSDDDTGNQVTSLVWFGSATLYLHLYILPYCHPWKGSDGDIQKYYCNTNVGDIVVELRGEVIRSTAYETEHCTCRK